MFSTTHALQYDNRRDVKNMMLDSNKTNGTCFSEMSSRYATPISDFRIINRAKAIDDFPYITIVDSLIDIVHSGEAYSEPLKRSSTRYRKFKNFHISSRACAIVIARGSDIFTHSIRIELDNISRRSR